MGEDEPSEEDEEVLGGVVRKRLMGVPGEEETGGAILNEEEE